MSSLFQALFNQNINRVILLLEAKANPNVYYTSACPLTQKGDHCTCISLVWVLTTGWRNEEALDKETYAECRDYHLPNGQMLTFLLQRAYLSRTSVDGCLNGFGKYNRFSSLKDWQMIDLLLYYGANVYYRIKRPRNVGSFPTRRNVGSSPPRPYALTTSRTWPKYDAPCTFLEYSCQYRTPFSLTKWQIGWEGCRDIQTLIREYVNLELIAIWYKLHQGHVKLENCSQCTKVSVGVSNCKHLPLCYTHKRSSFFSCMCDCDCEECNSMDGQGQKGCDECLSQDVLVNNWLRC